MKSLLVAESLTLEVSLLALDMSRAVDDSLTLDGSLDGSLARGGGSLTMSGFFAVE